MKVRLLFAQVFLIIGLMTTVSGMAQDQAAAPTVSAPPPPPPPPPPLNSTPARAAARGVNRGPFTPPSPPLRMELPRATIYSIWNSEEQLNNYYVNRFISSAGFGGVRMTVPTMQINPDIRLLQEQVVKLDGVNLTAIQPYQIEQLELIGIAKHETPVAFVVNRHSAFIINQTRQTTPSRWSVPTEISGTRSLTDFEKTALDEIKAGKNVADQPQNDGTLFIVGAVRAQEACLQCHTGYKVGEALGALTYRLRPDRAFAQSLATSNPPSASTP